MSTTSPLPILLGRPARPHRTAELKLLAPRRDPVPELAAPVPDPLATLADACRLAALRHAELLDGLPEEALDRLTRLATRLLGTPVAVVSLVTEERQLFASEVGVAEPWRTARGTPLSHSFCRHVVESGEALVIDDARDHPLVCDSPGIAELHVVAYAGVPLTLSDGRTLGAFCAIDGAPRTWSARDLEGLRDLAALAVTEIEARVRAGEKAEADRAAEAAASRFRTTFEQAAVGIAHVAPGGRWLRVNERLCDMLGYDREALLARAHPELTHPDDRSVDLAELQLLRDGALPWYRVEKRYLHRDGHHVWAVVTLSLVRDATGAPDYFIAVAEDCSERKRAESALRTSERDLQAAQTEILERLAQAAELRDDDTGLHTRRVGELSARLAEALGLPDEEVQLLRLAAPLHDVGKIGVPDAVLLKPGRLTAEERASIERHAAAGASILAGSRTPLLRLAETIAHAHHERWDGTGYPRGLAGEAIPLAARIVAVADVFDALSHDRPYRAAWTRERVVAHLRAGAGTHFDPQLVEAFLRSAGLAEVDAWVAPVVPGRTA